MLREQRGIGARRREQVKRHRADHDAHDQQVLDGAAFQRRMNAGQVEHHGVTLQRYQSEPKFHSREASAFN